MTLEKYKQKRKFSVTSEPKGKGEKKSLNRFVVQKHQARNLHYDFRLEHEGVLKSWALPKKPPRQPGIKRLAVNVADHELSYLDFTGSIPNREYGAGLVKLWDKGYYTLRKQSRYELVVSLNGKKLNGDYCLIKLKKHLPNDKNWLFFKKKRV